MSDDGFGEITGAWDYATLPKNVRVGAGCWLERKASFERFRSTRDPGLVLGAGVRVHTWTTFNVEPAGTLLVGDRSVLVGATFMCADRITIGSDVVIDDNRRRYAPFPSSISEGRTSTGRAGMPRWMAARSTACVSTS